MNRHLCFVVIFSILVFGIPAGILVAEETNDLRATYSAQEAKKWINQIFHPIIQGVGGGIPDQQIQARKAKLEAEMADSFRKLLNPDTVQKLSEWFKNEKNRNIAGLAAMANDLRAVTVFRQQNGLGGLKAARSQQVERLRKALNKGKLDAAYAFFMQAAFSRSMDVLTMDAPIASPPGSFFPLSPEENTLYEKADALHSEQALHGLAYAFQAASDDDLETYLAFLEKDPGKNWMDASYQANLEGIRSGAEIFYELGWKVHYEKRMEREKKRPDK